MHMLMYKLFSSPPFPDPEMVNNLFFSTLGFFILFLLIKKAVLVLLKWTDKSVSSD